MGRRRCGFAVGAGIIYREGDECGSMLCLVLLFFAIFLHFNFMASSRCATHLFRCGILDMVEFDAIHDFCHISVDQKGMLSR
jgi:hypothetical protein